MASKRALQNTFGTQKVGGLFSKLAPNFYNWGLSRPKRPPCSAAADRKAGHLAGKKSRLDGLATAT